MCLGVTGTCTVPWLTNRVFEKIIFKSNLPNVPTLDLETFQICCAPGYWLTRDMCHITGRLTMTCHVATCLNGEPLGKSDIVTLRVVWHGNDSTQGHQIGAAGQHMSPACRIGEWWPHGARAIARATAAGQFVWSNILILMNARVLGNRREAVSFDDVVDI